MHVRSAEQPCCSPSFFGMIDTRFVILSVFFLGKGLGDPLQTFYTRFNQLGAEIVLGIHASEVWMEMSRYFYVAL